LPRTDEDGAPPEVIIVERWFEEFERLAPSP